MNFIYTTFEISDYTNGIVPSTIGLVPGSVGRIVTSGIQTPDGFYRIIIPIEISASGYVEISATNFCGQTTIQKENNFVVGCSEGRKTSLVKYLPQYLRDNPDGSSSEFFQFVSVFEDYLNTIYSNIDSSCNISTLEKTKKLREFRNIDKIDSQYIYQYANMLGYDVGINRSEIGTFSSTSGTYLDSLEKYQEKCLRFVVGNLPNWYSIKTTRNSVKMMLLSFGIIGDLIENYTLDYDKYWKQNRTKAGQFVDETITKEWYPTPHISVGIDLRNTQNDIVYSDQVKKVISSMETIRPANAVIDSLQGYITEITTPTIGVSVSFRTSKSINVSKKYQINFA
jgi:hypothetical protein